MALCLSACASDAKKPFTNTEINYQSSWSQVWQIAKAYWRDNRQHATPSEPIPMTTLRREALLNESHDVVYKLGHSSMLIHLDGEWILIDPVFSDRAFPVQWFGPKRFHPTPIEIEQLPPITAVVISHDHYDHLDKHAIKQLAKTGTQFVVPLKVGDHLLEWDVNKKQITELDWWQKTTINGVNIIATPSQHFSGRTLTDRDLTLWASWVIKGWDKSLFYSGDSGYFSGFKKIGDKYGPFDLTMIETGAYNEMWSDIHMMPEQSVQAHIDVKGKVMMPVHNSTFDLALHNWFEPLELVSTYAKENSVTLSTPIVGERVVISELAMNHSNTSPWWRALMPSEQSSPENKIHSSAVLNNK